MGHQSNHEWHHMKGGDGLAGMPVLFIPIPMAMFGMCVAFMFGATIGMIWGKKSGMAMYGGKHWMHHKGWKRGMSWRKQGAGHHHHGFGSPPCCEMHEASPETQQIAEETPVQA